MNIRECSCGGVRVKATRKLLKTSEDVKVRMRCKSCRSWLSVYEMKDGRFSLEKRPIGRPFDRMVMA